MSEPSDLPTHPEFARQIEQAEVEAWTDLEPLRPGSRQIEVRPVDGAILVVDRVPQWPHSRLLNLGVIRPASAELIRDILAIVQDAGIGVLRTDVSPIARPGTLARILTQAGFRQTERGVVVARSTQAMPEPDSYFRLRAATEDDRNGAMELMRAVMPEGHDWIELLGDQIGRPNWRYYLSREGEGFSGLTGIHLGGDMAWLAPIWVHPDFRNRGTQAALIAHATRDAEAMGAQWITTTYPAAMPGRTRNFERLGFSIVYLRNHFVWEAPQS